MDDFVAIDEQVAAWMAAHKLLTIERIGDAWELKVWEKYGTDKARMKTYTLAHPDFMHAIFGLVRLAIQAEATR